MNSNFPNNDDLIRRAARNVRQNNEEPEPSFKDASDDQVARQKADFEKDEPPDDDDVQVVCGSIDKDGKVHEVPADEIPDSVREFIDDLTNGAFSKRNPPKDKLPKRSSRKSPFDAAAHTCSKEELEEIEKAVEHLQELCVKYKLPGTAMVQVCNTFWGFGARGFRYTNKRTNGQLDLFMKVGDILFSDKPPRPEDLKDFAEVVSRMLKHMKGGSDA